MKIFKIVVIFFSMFAVNQVSAQKKEKKVKAKFAKINSDGNEFISEAEWTAFYKDKKNKKGKTINSKRLFLGHDRNGDKRITLDEMIKGFDKELVKPKKKGQKKKKN